MKVLIDAHAAIQKKTGIGRYTGNLISNLDEKDGVEINLYTHSPTLKSFEKYPQYKAPMKNGLFRVFTGLNNATRKLNPDIVHISNFAPIVKTKPIVMTVHDLCFKSHAEKYPLKTKLAFKFFFQMSLTKADAIICVSESVKKELLRLYEVVPKKISVIYEAPDPVFKPVSKKTAKTGVKREFGIDKPFFLVVGNIEPRKNPDLITNAFKRFKKENPDYQLVFAGPNLKKKEMEAKNLGFIKDKDLNLLYNATEALIYYSDCEGFGLPIIEAMSTKTPVICSNLKVFKEVAKDAALYTKNKKEIAESMNKIVNKPKLKSKLVKKGQKVIKKYSWKNIAQRTLEVYEDIL